MSMPEDLDRYIPFRSPVPEATSTLRTSLSPESLSSRERFSRRYDASRDPFRSMSMPRTRAKQRVSAMGNGMLAPHYVPSFVQSEELDDTPRTPRRQNVRYVSLGGVWSVGGRLAAIPTQLQGIETGMGDTLARGTNATMVDAGFVSDNVEDKKSKAHEARLALALDIDQARRGGRRTIFDWSGSKWTSEPATPTKKRASSVPATKPEKAVPSVAFRVLDAPRLKDDFYCSVLAYCYTCRTLAVALTHRVYLWTEQHGVRYPPLAPARMANYVSALAFSSTAGGKAVLATARNSGHVTLWSLFEQKARFEVPHPWATCSVVWRPTVSYRQMPSSPDPVPCEDLLVGDDSGCIFYYSVHWPEFSAGHMTLLTKLDAHSQNICGLAWSPDGQTFVSGGNDNAALLFEAEAVTKNLERAPQVPDEDQEDDFDEDTSGLTSACYLTPPQSPESQRIRSNAVHSTVERAMVDPFGSENPTIATPDVLTPPQSPERAEVRGRTLTRLARDPVQAVSLSIPPIARVKLPQNIENHLANPGIEGRSMMHKQSFYHSAAVKAIAYAPWQPTLLATGGGSNDRQIHFHHTESGSTLAVINVYAQVTSLSWSCTRRELVATFGYAQPEHDIRIAVFAWPSCECVVSIPWDRKPNGEIGRALWAIPYPGGPNDAGPDVKDDTDVGFQAWEAIRAREEIRRQESDRRVSQRRASTEVRNTQWPQLSAMNGRPGGKAKTAKARRGEGETWASRTEEEGSLIIACCDQTVKFFEVWAGKSKGRSRGVGSKAGVLGGSKVLEGWCQGVGVDEVSETDSIR